MMGSAIIAGKATDLIDAGFFLTQAYDDWFGEAAEAEGARGSCWSRTARSSATCCPRADRGRLSGDHGADADGGAEPARGRRDFDVIVSDIEMPGMGGFEFARTLRETGAGTTCRWSR